MFEGTVIIVSHDRDFLHGLTNKTFEFTKEGIREHLDDINDFLNKKQMEDMRLLAKRDEDKKPAANTAKQQPTKVDDNKEREKEQKKQKAELEKCEKRIEELETEIKALDTKLLDPNQYNELTKAPDFFANYDKLKKQLEEEMAKWERLSA